MVVGQGHPRFGNNPAVDVPARAVSTFRLELDDVWNNFITRQLDLAIAIWIFPRFLTICCNYPGVRLVKFSDYAQEVIPIKLGFEVLFDLRTSNVKKSIGPFVIQTFLEIRIFPYFSINVLRVITIEPRFIVIKPLKCTLVFQGKESTIFNNAWFTGISVGAIDQYCYINPVFRPGRRGILQRINAVYVCIIVEFRSLCQIDGRPVSGLAASNTCTSIRSKTGTASDMNAAAVAGGAAFNTGTGFHSEAALTDIDRAPLSIINCTIRIVF